jgi:hypothetical protein
MKRALRENPEQDGGAGHILEKRELISSPYLVKI